MCSKTNEKPITGFYHGLGKDLFAKMMQQDHPTLNIHYERRPGINASVIQISPNTVIPENFAPAKVEILPEYVRRDPELSSNIIRQIVPTKARYKPETGGKPFISHSSRPIPNVMCKEQIKACAETVAICRACNKDPIAIKRCFNIQWGLPDSFDVEKYSPVVNPERSKAWLRWCTQQNYEVHYAQDAQAMIHVSAGSYTNQSKFGTFAVDWAQIRNHLRIIATNVFLCEPGVIQRVLSDGKKIELNFAVNFLEHSEVQEPTFAFRPEKAIIANPMLKEDIELLMQDTGQERRTVQDRKAEIFKLLPSRVIEEIRDSKQHVVMMTSTFSDNMPDAALSSETFGVSRKIVVTQPTHKTVQSSLQSCLKQFLKSWLLQAPQAMASAHSISAKYRLGKKDDAMQEMIKILDSHIIATAINAYGRYYSSGSERQQFKELLDIIFGPVTEYPNFDRRSIMSMITAAYRQRSYFFLQLFDEAYYTALHRRTFISLHDFIDYKDLRHRDELTLRDIQSAAYRSISTYFCKRYAERIKVLKSIQAWRNNEEVRKEVIRLQTRMRYYPAMGIKRDEQILHDMLYDGADKFTRKRMRFRREGEILPKPDLQNMPKLVDYAAKIDKIFNTLFQINITDCEYKASQTLKDIETLTWDGKPKEETIKSLKKGRPNKPTKSALIMSEETQQTIIRNELGDIKDDEPLGSAQMQIKTGRRPWHEVGKKFHNNWVAKIVTTEISHSNMFMSSNSSMTNSPKPKTTTDEPPIMKQELPKAPPAEQSFSMSDLLSGYDSEEEFIKRTVTLSDWYGSSGSHGNCFDLIAVMKTKGVELKADEDYDPEILRGYIDEHRKEISEESIRSLSDMYKAQKQADTDDTSDITSQPQKRSDEQ